jgi:hypothetical protein
MEQTATAMEIEAPLRAAIGFDRLPIRIQRGPYIEPRIIVSPFPLELK